MSTVELTIAQVRTGTHRRRGSDYAHLMTRVKHAGLLKRRPLYYAVRIAVNALLFAAGWVVFVLLGDSWWQLVTAAYLAVVFTQTGFLGGLPYVETSLVGSYRQTVQYLHTVGRTDWPVRP